MKQSKVWVRACTCVCLCVFASCATAFTIVEEIDNAAPGPGSTAARMWALYLPHLISSRILRENEAPDFITHARNIGLRLGFNTTDGGASVKQCDAATGVYVGDGASLNTGLMYTRGGWWDENGHIMSATTPSQETATLLAITIRNIDNITNTLCPCVGGGVCMDVGDKLPNVCMPSLPEESYGGDGILLNVIVLVVVVGLVMLLRTSR